MALLRRFLLHLRLPFNSILSPLFLWGALAAGGSLDGRFWVGFVAFHLFLYGGTNMFNSYYDRDVGPIGGLARPPRVARPLLLGSLALKAAGLVVATRVGAAFTLCYLLFIAYSLAYSHPVIRLKRRPLASAVSVFCGQGLVGYAAGWLASGGEGTALASAGAIVGGVAAALMASALYPVTQLYQLEEDSRRGDLTLARWLGAPRVFVYVAALLLPAILGAAAVFWWRGSPWAAALVLLIIIPGAATALHRIRRVLGRNQAARLYRHAMRLNYANSTAFLLLIAAHFLTR